MAFRQTTVPPREHLAMSGDVLVVYWHLVGRGQGHCCASYSTQTASNNKELPGPKRQQYNIEKPPYNRVPEGTFPILDLQHISQALAEIIWFNLSR